MYAGIIPFIGGAGIALIGPAMPISWSAWPEWYRAYTLVIGSFMAGTLWQDKGEVAPGFGAFLLTVSNLAALGLWIAFGSLSNDAFLVAAAVMFWVILGCDLGRSLEASYLRDRIIITTMVSGALVCVAIVS